MHALFQTSPIAIIARFWDWLGNRVLGATARAGRLMADADARLVGLGGPWGARPRCGVH